jgi:hypothetical protein
LLSSAILYVAIVAIWACVLVPRWLRRDSALPSPAPTEEQLSDDGTAAAEAGEEPAPPRRRRHREGRGDDAGEWRPAPGRAADERSAPGRAADERSAPGGVADERSAPGGVADERSVPGEDRGMPRDLAHRRVLSSRRRLLGMLVVLTIGSGVLAGTRLAAWWVIVPPSVMLLCYLLLLRAAAKADAERWELTRAWTADAAVTGDSGAAGVPGVPGVPGVRDVRRAAAASRAEIIDISASRGPAAQGSHGGRGSQAGHGVRGGEEIYDQDEDARLRAVGD